MDIIKEANLFEKSKLSHMFTSDRVEASREAKRLLWASMNYTKKTKTET